MPHGAHRTIRGQFALYSVWLYKLKAWCNDTLFKYFAEGFNSFSEAHFAERSASTRRDFCDLLRRQSLYVKIGRNILIATSLNGIKQNKITWPEDDIKAPSNQKHSTISRTDSNMNRRSTSKNSSALAYTSNMSKA